MLIVALLSYCMASSSYLDTFDSWVILLLLFQLIYHYQYSTKILKNNPLISLNILYLIGLVAASFSVHFMLAACVFEFGQGHWNYLIKESSLSAAAVVFLAASGFRMWFICFKNPCIKLATSLRKREFTDLHSSQARHFVFSGILLLTYLLLYGSGSYLYGDWSDVRNVFEEYEISFSVAQILLALGFAIIIFKVMRVVSVLRIENLYVPVPFTSMFGVLATDASGKDQSRPSLFIN